jgi:hypothetical protein
MALRSLFAIAACALLAPGAAPVTAAAPVTVPDGVQALVVSTQHWVGDNLLLLELFDTANQPIAGDDVDVRLTLRGPDGAERPPVAAQRARYARAGRDVYAAQVTLPMVGPWEVAVTASRGGGSGVGVARFLVRRDEGTPALGAPVPGGATPTLRDAGNLMDAISSDPEPVSAFYTTTVDRAIADSQPFLFVIDSYAYRPNEACGGPLGIVHDIYFEYPGLTVVHGEPWHLAFREGVLTLDPPGGPARLTDWSVAWGVAEPPWVFVVDRDGRLKAKFTGIFGTDELRAAMASVSPWRPPG